MRGCSGLLATWTMHFSRVSFWCMGHSWWHLGCEGTRSAARRAGEGVRREVLVYLGGKLADKGRPLGGGQGLPVDQLGEAVQEVVPATH
jgi:hypothetical protein